MNSKYIVRQPIKDAENGSSAMRSSTMVRIRHSAGRWSWRQRFRRSRHHLQFPDAEYRQAASGVPEFYDLYHYSADEKDTQAV